MPLTSRAAAHITAKLAVMWQGRTQPIVFTLRTPGGGTTTTTVDGIWRPQGDLDPSVDPVANRMTQDDVWCMVAASDMTLQQLRSAIYVAPQSLLADEPSARYLITSITPKGMKPGSDRYFLTLTRQG